MSQPLNEHDRYWRARQNEVPISVSTNYRSDTPSYGWWIDHVQVYRAGFCFDVSLLLKEPPRLDYDDLDVAVGVDVVVDGSATRSSDDGPLHRIRHSVVESLIVLSWWVGARPMSTLSVQISWLDRIKESVDLDISTWPTLGRETTCPC